MAGNKSHTFPLCLLQPRIKITPSICPQPLVPGTSLLRIPSLDIPRQALVMWAGGSIACHTGEAEHFWVLSAKAVSLIKVVLMMRGEPSTTEELGNGGGGVSLIIQVLNSENLNSFCFSVHVIWPCCFLWGLKPVLLCHLDLIERKEPRLAPGHLYLQSTDAEGPLCVVSPKSS